MKVPSASKKSDKILILGLAESGKTTIIKVVTEGYIANKKAPYSATMNYERKSTTLLGKELTIFDLGGQIAFLDRFTGELAEFIFSNVIALIFIVDIVKISELSRVKYYLDLALKKIKEFSPTAAIHMFLHKIDLIDQKKVGEITDYIKQYLTSNSSLPISYYKTSVFNESIFNAVGVVFGEATGTKKQLGDLVMDFRNNNQDFIDALQLYSETFVPLIDNTKFKNINMSQVKEVANSLVHQCSDSKDSAKSVLIESADHIFNIRFIDNGGVLFISLNPQEVVTKGNLGDIYIKTSMLNREINRVLAQY